MTIEFDFSVPPNTNLGTTHTFIAPGGYTLSATGYGGDLYAVNTGGDDVGVGLIGHPDHEIYPGSFVQFDISGYSGITFTPGSSDADVWQVFGSDTAGSLGTFLVQGGDDTPALIPSAYEFLSVTSSSCCGVLAGGLSAEVPEPATLGLIGIGLVLLAFVKWPRPKVDRTVAKADGVPIYD